LACAGPWIESQAPPKNTYVTKIIFLSHETN
jgi:hypothetical protein